jgi:hypothetical protein
MRRSRPTLERELSGLLGTGRTARIAARYYGFDGQGGGSLRTVGSEVGLTPERVRQIVTKTSKLLGAGRPVPQTLDRTIAFVVGRMPASAGEIEAELRSKRLTSGLFRLKGVMKAAELLGRPLPFSTTEERSERLVHGRDIAAIDTIIGIAQRAISKWGMATLSHVVAEVRKVESGVCDTNLVASVLACRGGFCWLDQPGGWFCLSDIPNNRVLSRVRKILSVANPIGLAELRAGIARDYRMKGFSPPARVLLEFCRQAPGLRVYRNKIKATPGINQGDVLTQTERSVVHILSEHGGTMAVSEFMSVCLGMGEIPVDAHPESFQLEKPGTRVLINVPDKMEIQVADLANGGRALGPAFSCPSGENSLLLHVARARRAGRSLCSRQSEKQWRKRARQASSVWAYTVQE